MEIKGRIRKQYKKPQITEVKLEITEAVLANCKLTADDATGKGGNTCGNFGCKGDIFGS